MTDYYGILGKIIKLRFTLEIFVSPVKGKSLKKENA